MTKYKIDSIKFKYKAVPNEERHPDYQLSGVAPIVGHHLNEIAQEDSDRGAFAEGILRTGAHNLLPILNDKLGGDDYTNPHPSHAEYDKDYNRTSGPIDWHHAPRAIAIDKATEGRLKRGPIAYNPVHGTYNYVPAHIHNIIHSWVQKNGIRPTQRTILRGIKETVPDATPADLHHSIIRLGLNHVISQNEYNQPIHTENANQQLRQLGTKIPNAHEYVDTRPVNKRQPVLYKMKAQSWVGGKIKKLKVEGYPHKQAIAIALSMAGRSRKQKYAATRAGSKGMVDQVSPLAAFGEWRKPGEFSTSLQFETARNKPSHTSSEFTAGRFKPVEPASRYLPEKKRHLLLVEYVRKLALHLKKLKSKK
jgi:hypothetical protein